jgi:hypothetical protein
MNATRQFFRKNGLSVTLLSLFVIFWIGQFCFGFHAYNDELQSHRWPAVSESEYLSSGHFWESTFENWESEFLQMALYVILTTFLYQKGSSESNPLPEEKEDKKVYRKKYFAKRFWLRKIYENSLSLALGVLFLISFFGHLESGLRHENLNRAMAPVALPPLEMKDFLGDPEFWFQSMQNWQSEFLSVGVIVILSIFLRQKDSSQSKEVDAPHFKTEE